MSRARRRRGEPDPELTLGARLAVAIASLLFSVPTAAVLWLLLSSHVAGHQHPQLVVKICVGFVAAVCALGFAFPKQLPDWFGGLWEGLLGSSRYW